MTESVPSNDADAQKRRSTRIAQSIPITVMGVDALGQAFKERTTTVSINCHGCKYQSKHYIPKNSQMTVEIARLQSDLPSRVVEAKVAWVQRPRTVRELFQIGVEFTVPGNVWGIAFPPSDWFPCPVEQPTLPAPSPKQEGNAAGAAHKPATPEEISAGSGELEPGSALPATSAADNKLHVLPTPASGLAQETMSMARQMARLLAEAKQHLNRNMQSGAAEAVANEVRTARAEVETQLRNAVHEAVEAAVAEAAQKSVQTAVQGSLQQLVEKATQQVVQNTLAAIEKTRQSSTQAPEELDQQVRAAVERVVETSAAKLAEQTVQQSVQQTVEQAVRQSVQSAVEKATAHLPALASPAQAGAPGEILRQLEESAQERIAGWRKEIEDVAGQLEAQSRDRLNSDSEVTARQWREQMEAAMKSASAQMSEQLAQISQAATARTEEELSSRGAELKNLLDSTATDAQMNLDALCSQLQQERSSAESAADKVSEAVRRAEETSNQIESISHAAFDDAKRQLDGLLESQSEVLNRRTEELIRQKAGELENPINEIANSALRRLAEQVEQQLSPQIVRAEEASLKLAEANVVAESAVRELRERMRDATEQALTASLERIRHETAELPAEFEQTCRAALARVEEELDAKSTEATHTTFEALYKAADWYQKKAQTSMQAALEKSLEQSTGSMRERAAELSRVFASELDHYSRSYVEHAQGMLEESAKEIKQQTREQMEISAKTVTAGLADELHRATSNALTKFEEATKATSEQSQAEMKSGAESAMEEFDAHIEERMVLGAARARQQLEEQLKPLVDAFYAKREAEQKAWLDQMNGVVEQSIEQYKERLENTSNSWLLASATTLGHHSKGVIETLSKAAEERLRDTCADVFSGLGETLRQRLLGISSEVGTEKKTPKKE